MRFRDSPLEIDPLLKAHLDAVDNQHSVIRAQGEAVFRAEQQFLTLKNAKDAKWGAIYELAPEGTIERKKAWTSVHKDWWAYTVLLSDTEARFHLEKRKYDEERDCMDLKMKFCDAAYLTLKVERMSIERGVGQ